MDKNFVVVFFILLLIVVEFKILIFCGELEVVEEVFEMILVD